MKGIIFSTFNKMIEEKFGLELWEELLEETKPPSEGLYTSSGTYPDEELLNMVVYLSKKTNTPVGDLVRVFGEYAFHKLVGAYPIFAEGKTIKEFLLSIHDVIHVEVKKLYPEAELPIIKYEDPGENQLVLIYTSKRNLPTLAEGLIQGAAEHYKVNIEIKCSPVHEQENTYRFELKFEDS